MNTQNTNSSEQSTIGEKSGNAAAKIIAMLMLVAVAGGGYYFYTSQTETEKDREQLLQNSELIGSKTNTEKSSNESESFYGNALDDASSKIQKQDQGKNASQNTGSQTVDGKEGTLSSSSSSNADSSKEGEVDQYLGFKIVTEANPEAQALKDEEDRQRALASFENEVQGEQVEITDENGNVITTVRNRTTAPSQDKVISSNFIDGFAQYLVENYANLSNSSPLKASSYYGSNLRDLPNSAGFAQSREFIMDYVYTSQTLARLYQAYEEQFLAAYKMYANSPQQNGSTYSQDEIKRMDAFYANYASSLAQALVTISDVTEFDELMHNLYAAEKNVNDTQDAFARAQVEFDEARYANKPLDVLRKKIQDYAPQVERANENLKVRESELIAKIMQRNNLSLSTQDLTNLCRWLARRKAQIANTRVWQETNRELANIFSNISVKIKQ